MTLRHYNICVTMLIVLIASENIAHSEKVSKYASTVDHLRQTYLALGETAWGLIGNSSTADTQQTILNHYKEFVKQANAVNANFDEFFMLRGMWRQLQKDLLMSTTLFDTFTMLLGNYHSFDERTVKDFAETILDDEETPFEKRLDNIYTVMVGENYYKNIEMQVLDRRCAVKMSPQLVLFHLYNSISITELKAYAMMEFSWIMRTIYGIGDFTAKSKQMREQFQSRTTQAHLLIRPLMHRSDREVSRCDPVHHIEGETYEQITRLLQGYIENEVDMNKDRTCWENCPFYFVADNYGCTKKSLCTQQPRCGGKIISCQTIHHDLRICPSSPKSPRRYEYIELENGEVYGAKSFCPRPLIGAAAWNKLLFFECSYCLCICDNPGPLSDRYFNLREYVSDIANNRVVTGLRFKKVNRIIHLQIQEGQLMERGQINASTVTWKPISDYQIIDRGIRSDVDYHMLSWNNRSIDLDDVIHKDSPNHVVTGVRFHVIGSHLNLAVQFSEVNFETGQLIDAESTSVWAFNHNTDNSEDKRTKLTLHHPSDPTKTGSVIDSHSNQYIEFDHSDRQLDAAQLTIPFIDTQEVITNPKVPLSGVGIYHKGRDLSGGFVAPKLFTYDFAPHIVLGKIDENVSRK